MTSPSDDAPPVEPQIWPASDLFHLTDAASAAGYKPLSTLWTWYSRFDGPGEEMEPVAFTSPPVFSWERSGAWLCQKMDRDPAEVWAKMRSARAERERKALVKHGNREAKKADREARAKARASALASESQDGTAPSPSPSA